MPGHAKLERTPLAGAPHHAILGAVAARAFEQLGLGASIFYAENWLDLHEHTAIVDFEIEHGGEVERWAHNDRCIAAARKSGASVFEQHHGMTDLFVPLRVGSDVPGVIVVGPFLTAEPNAESIVEHWYALTGRKGDLGDSEFASYVRARLSTVVLDAKLPEQLQRMTECLAALMTGSGSARALYLELEKQRDELLKARMAERMAAAASGMVDDNTTRVWAASCRDGHLSDLGLKQFPKYVLAGLHVGLGKHSDPITELLSVEAFRRSCARMAHENGNTIFGRIGDSGIAFLSASKGSVPRSRSQLVELARRVTSVARKRFGLSLHMGLSTQAGPLGRQYQSAVAAAELALGREVALVHSAPGVRPRETFGPRRQELARLAEENPKALAPYFDRYLELVAQRYAGRLDAARVQAETGFDAISEALVRSGSLDNKSLSSLRAKLEHTATTSTSLAELARVYREALRGIMGAGKGKPAPSRHERGLMRAEAYMREHRGEPLTRAKVARIAGFAETYFSELFHEKRGVTFGRYLTALRVEHAKRLLLDTPLHLQRIAELCGLKTRQYLGRVFKAETGETPAEFRERGLRGHAPYKYVP